MPNNIRRIISIATSGVTESSMLLTGQMTPAPQAASTVLTFATTVTGTATYTLSYSYQDVGTVGAITRWLPFSDMTDATTSVDFQSNRQILALKLAQTVGTGSVNLDFILEFQS